MTGRAADTTDDVGCEVALLRTIVLAVTDPTAVLADLVLVVAQSSVQRGQLAKLVTLVVILTLRRGGSLL